MIEIKNVCYHNPPGAFSHIYTVLDWVHNSIYTNEKIFINWDCGFDGNLWEVFFEQPKFNVDTHLHLKVTNPRSKQDVFENINDVIPIYDKYNGYFCNNVKVFCDEQFSYLRNEYNKSWSYITVKDNIKQYVENFTQKFKGFKVLGVAVRCPTHYFVNNIDSNIFLHNKIDPNLFYEKVISEIEIEFNNNNYDKIFVCCDVEPFINLLISKFGKDNILYTEYDRVKDLNQDWFCKNTPIQEEYKMVIIDSLILSNCNYLLGSSSNIFLITLFINKTVNFKLFEILNNCYGL
jgi:hypothetical protein